MKLVPYKKDGQEIPGQYLVVVPTLFGEAVLFGPATLAACEEYIVAKVKELGKDLTQQIKMEREKQALRESEELEQRNKGYSNDYSF